MLGTLVPRSGKREERNINTEDVGRVIRIEPGKPVEDSVIRFRVTGWRLEINVDDLNKNGSNPTDRQVKMEVGSPTIEGLGGDVIRDSGGIIYYEKTTRDNENNPYASYKVIPSSGSPLAITITQGPGVRRYLADRPRYTPKIDQDRGGWGLVSEIPLDSEVWKRLNEEMGVINKYLNPLERLSLFVTERSTGSPLLRAPGREERAVIIREDYTGEDNKIKAGLMGLDSLGVETIVTKKGRGNIEAMTAELELTKLLEGIDTDGRIYKTISMTTYEPETAQLVTSRVDSPTILAGSLVGIWRHRPEVFAYDYHNLGIYQGEVRDLVTNTIRLLESAIGGEEGVRDMVPKIGFIKNTVG